ncbi:MBL fold metallo-hydrolase [Kaistia algarum]|uniref:ribonuclease J n=1 Tax=Kaistia algarum TaxID=2083279 RepID=UPI000CE84D14|nr:ribonuclease J [Kaistia algarum]MCX5512011.1 ribonuclease J [Kaistia algarum]PPE80138.1 MBL fold metallo-hydrolase [Kaistia algarum]
MNPSRNVPDEFVFLPIGGVGEIGMNLALYGMGPSKARQWIAVDFGVSFAGPDLPGVDLVLPDIRYLEEQKERLLGIVITHAHEDHFGALLDLWPRLRVPVYASAFTAGLLQAKRASYPGSPPIPIQIVTAGDRINLGPFEVEFVAVAHSILEPMALAIRTSLGTVVHTGDWKLDPEPVLGWTTDAQRFAAIGDEGVLALVCDSTNAMREGRSPSESDVARELEALVGEATGRVAFTSFASNVARIRSIAMAAQAHDRQVVIVGRALRRAIEVATELGYMEGVPPFLDEEAYGYLPRSKVVAIFTGSQGESRAALARIAEDEHKFIGLSPGDIVVFSARAIPGNEKAIGAIINALVDQGVQVITDRDRLVHVSGHPRRDELAEMYGWVRPEIAIPVHGEPMHLVAHAALAREMGVGQVLDVEDGALIRLAPGPAQEIDEVLCDRLYKDGIIVADLEGVGVPERRKLSFAGHVAVSVILDGNGSLMLDPDIALTGLPLQGVSWHPFEETVMSAVLGTIESIPRARRRDSELLREAIRRAVRAAVREAWGKKPLCTVFVAVV